MEDFYPQTNYTCPNATLMPPLPSGAPVALGLKSTSHTEESGHRSHELASLVVHVLESNRPSILKPNG